MQEDVTARTAVGAADPAIEGTDGLARALEYPLFSAIFNRRTRRVSKGIKSISAGPLSYSSNQEPQPLSPLEEALLIAATGITGIPMHDVPFQTDTGEKITMSVMLNASGRAASSPDNAQATHFFLLNDEGTFLLQRPDDDKLEPFTLSRSGVTATKLIELANNCKVKVQDRRLDLVREYPCYIGTNRYVSNLPGSTVLVPVVDTSRYYINVLLFLLGQERDGFRSSYIDDWRFYRKAGVSKWVRNGYLNDKVPPIPLGWMGTFRVHIEADLLMQNLLLTIQAMGLGGWIHASFPGPFLLGDPEYSEQYGLGLKFRYMTPKTTIRRLLLRPVTPLPAWRPNPVGLDGLLEGFCPPYYKTMADAVDALVEMKEGPQGVYSETRLFDQVYKPGLAEEFVRTVPRDTPEAIACTKDICNYIYDTYGRFPAHVDAMHVPGVCVQAHHLDLEYYDQFFTGGYTRTQADHDQLWHGK